MEKTAKWFSFSLRSLSLCFYFCFSVGRRVNNRKAAGCIQTGESMMLMRKVNANCQKIITTCCAPSQCTSHQFKMYMYVKSDSNVFRVVIKIQLQMYNCCVCTTIFLCFSIFHVLVSVNIVMHYGVIVFQKNFTF